MYDRNEVHKAIKPLLAKHLTKAPRKVTILHIDGLPLGIGGSGCYIEPNPFRGKVIEITDLAVIIKDAANSFKVCKRSLMSQEPSIGDNVLITPYFRKQLDGQPVGETMLEDTQFINGDFIPKGQGRLFDEIAYLPGQNIVHEHTRILVNVLQQQLLSDGFRTITHLLADIKARSFALFDPTDPLTGTEGAVINFDVDSPKFKGNVVVRYHYERYQFSVYFNGTFDKTFENIPFNGLAKVLEEQLDDVSLTQIKVEVIPATVTEAIGH